MRKNFIEISKNDIKGQMIYNSVVNLSWQCCSFWERPCPYCSSSLKRLFKRLTAMDKALALAPRLAHIWREKALMLAEYATRAHDSPFTQVIEDALRCIEEALTLGIIDKSETIELVAKKGELLFLQENYEESLKFLQESFEMKYYDSLRLMVMSLCALERYDKALELYNNQPFLNNPPPERVEENLGLKSFILAGLGQYDQFIEDFEDKKFQELHDIGRFRYFIISDYYHFGKIFERYGNKELALEHYNQALRYNSSYLPTIRAKEMLLGLILH